VHDGLGTRGLRAGSTLTPAPACFSLVAPNCTTGELLKLVRDLRRALKNSATQNAAGVVKELESILAGAPGSDDADAPSSPSRTSAFASGLAAQLGHMRDAWGGLGAAGRARSRLSDSTSTAQQAASQQPSQPEPEAPEASAPAPPAAAEGGDFVADSKPADA
jgi:hypothetical protein